MKNLMKLGKTLNRSEQKEINGGKLVDCYSNPICPPIHEIACLVRGNTCFYDGGDF